MVIHRILQHKYLAQNRYLFCKFQSSILSTPIINILIIKKICLIIINDKTTYTKITIKTHLVTFFYEIKIYIGTFCWVSCRLFSLWFLALLYLKNFDLWLIIFSNYMLQFTCLFLLSFQSMYLSTLSPFQFPFGRPSPIHKFFFLFTSIELIESQSEMFPSTFITPCLIKYSAFESLYPDRF